MRSLIIICFVSLTGCLGGLSRGHTTTTYMHDDGHGVIERTVATQDSSGMNVGGSMPFGVNGGGYYGMPIVNGYGMLHNDERVGVYQTTLYSPTVVVSHGSGVTVASGNGAAASDDVSDLEARIAQIEELIPKIWGGTIQSLHQTCLLIVAHPDAIKDAVERDAVVKDCQAYFAEETQNQKKGE